MGLLMGFSNQKRQLQTYSGIEILIDKPENSRFVTDQNIESLFSNLGFGKENQTLTAIDIHAFEQKLERNPSVATANVHQTIDGKVVVQLAERKPIIRIYNQNDKSYYLDENGSLMPLSNQHTARVIIASGNINIPYSTVHDLEDLEEQIHEIFRQSNTSAIQNIKLIERLKMEEETLPGAKQLHDLFQLARYVKNDSFWDAQISQIYVAENGDFELIPRVGNHNIVLGSTEYLEEKFNNLMTFYLKGLNKTGWNEYSTINLKFKNQVVCTKK
jgi:cell division protein FtsQ